MGIRIDGNNDLIKAVDDTLTIEGISVNTSGMVTATGGIKVGTAATIHSTGQFNIGVAHTLFANGNATHSGIITATNINLTGGNATITGASAILHLIDENDNPNYRVQNVGGVFQIYDATSDAERLRVDSNGNIGVNGAATNISNQRGISIKGAGSNSSGFVDFLDSSGNSDGRIIADNGTITINADTDAATASSKIEFAVDGSEKLRIADSGQIGIAGANYGTSGQVLTSGGSSGAVSWSTVSGTTINNNANNRVITGSGSANTLEAESNMTFTGSILTLTNSSGSSELTLVTPSANDSGVYFNDGTNSGAVTYNHSDDSMRFRVGTQERLRITGVGGSVGINEDTPLYELVVSPVDSNESQIQILAGGNGKESNVLFGAPDDADVGSIKYDHNGDHMKFTVGTSEIFRANSHGICLGGTGSANGLDDYEEGTYTAHFNVEGQSNMSMSGRIGLYTKVGQVVTVMGGGTVASTGGESSSHAIQFTNLPFPVHTTSGTFGHVFPVLMRNLNSTGLGNMSGNQPYQFIGRLFVDNDSGRIEGIRSDGAQDPVNSSLAITTNSEMGYMFTYLTDA